MTTMKYLFAFAAVASLAAACGDDTSDDNSTDDTADTADMTDDTTDNTTPDGATPDGATPDGATPDSPAATVTGVPCPATPAANITTQGFAFSPTSVTIPVGGIVRFTPASNHNVIPHPTLPTDPGMQVDFGETKCLQFSSAGTFNFRCMPHSAMTGAVTVTP